MENSDLLKCLRPLPTWETDVLSHQRTMGFLPEKVSHTDDYDLRYPFSRSQCHASRPGCARLAEDAAGLEDSHHRVVAFFGGCHNLGSIRDPFHPLGGHVHVYS